MTDRPLDANTRLASERNRLALERTLMAWTRTSTSLIAFGFTIYQIFRYLSENDRLRDPFVSPQVFGVVMILVGLAALILGLIQHRQELRALKGGVRIDALLDRLDRRRDDRRPRPHRAPRSRSADVAAAPRWILC